MVFHLRIADGNYGVDEPVAYAADGLNIGGILRIIRKDAAERRYSPSDITFFNETVLPDVVQQFLLGDHPLAVFDQILQNRQEPGSQPARGTVAVQDELVWYQAKRTKSVSAHK